MADSYLGYIIGALVILAAILVVLLLTDKLLKTDNKKPDPNPTEEQPVEKPAEKPTTAVNAPVMQIYNSELADDLNELLKNSKNDGDSRLNVEGRIDRQSNITKYIHEKKYEGFNFVDDDSKTNQEEDVGMKFTREDYKKFMALSNIDDKK